MEAKVTMRMLGATDSRDALEYDPIDLPHVVTTGGMVLAPNDFGPLNTLALTLAEDEAMIQIVTFDLVWSETGESVRTACAACGHVGKAAVEMMPGAGNLVCPDCF